MRRKIRGVSEEELAANPLFTSRPQAPLQEQPPPPPRRRRRLLRRRREHLLRSCTLNRQPRPYHPRQRIRHRRLRRWIRRRSRIESSSISSRGSRRRRASSHRHRTILHPHLRPRCHHHRRAPQCRSLRNKRRRPQRRQSRSRPNKSSSNPSPSTHLKLPPSRRAPRWLMTSGGSFRNGSTRPNVPGSINAKSASSSPQSPYLDWSRILIAKQAHRRHARFDGNYQRHRRRSA